jgi:hypothetical protein
MHFEIGIFLSRGRLDRRQAWLLDVGLMRLELNQVVANRVMNDVND